MHGHALQRTPAPPIRPFLKDPAEGRDREVLEGGEGLGPKILLPLARHLEEGRGTAFF